jgi:hypothetical protein
VKETESCKLEERPFLVFFCIVKYNKNRDLKIIRELFFLVISNNFKGTVYACGVIDTACTLDEQFERPWQPLKGISIKNINVPELSYPTTRQMYKFKEAT